jgi:hypothetical protein
MSFNRDDVLKAWDLAIARIARNQEYPTDEEIAAVSAEVCAKCSVRPDQVTAALRSSVEEEKRNLAVAERALQLLKGLVTERSDTPLPGLPGGAPLKCEVKL